MISRRNIRVKVMQTLYTLESMGMATPEGYQQGITILNDKLKRSLDLFIASLQYIRKATEYASYSAAMRASKYLPSQADLHASTKIAGNEFLKTLENNASFIDKIKDPSITQAVNEEWIKKLFQKLESTDEYIAYIADNERNPRTEKQIIRFMWEKVMLENEGLMDYFSEELSGWEDDKEMTLMLMENFFKNVGKIDYSKMITAEKREYSHELLRTVLEKKDYCMELIEPKLTNWDMERVALIDLLLLRMGVCELLYFPTIPTKVTINEYIELAKLYSTLQSGHFVNGVLDNILKDLEKDNKIRKQDRIRR